jgi:uncharacterized membrane protein
VGFLFWLVIGAVVFYLLSVGGQAGWRPGGGSGHGPGNGTDTRGGEEATEETPRQILDRRLAKGEITVEEYRRILQELSSQ